MLNMAETLAIETSSPLTQAFQTPIAMAVDFLSGDARKYRQKRDENLVNIQLAMIDRLDALIKQGRRR